MDLTTYVGLCAAIASFLNRSDLTATVPAFVTLAEAKIKRRLRRTKLRSSVTFGAGADSYPIPATMAEILSARLDTGTPSDNLPLDITTPDHLTQLRTRYSSPGAPRYGAIIGSRLLLVPTPDETYNASVIYFAALTPLSASVTTNIVLAEAPDLYLYGALAEAEPFLEHDERVAMWQGKFDAALEELNNLADRESFSASPRRAPLPVVF